MHDLPPVMPPELQAQMAQAAALERAARTVATEQGDYVLADIGDQIVLAADPVELVRKLQQLIAEQGPVTISRVEARHLASAGPEF